jgi:hypothetical protein
MMFGTMLLHAPVQFQTALYAIVYWTSRSNGLLPWDVAGGEAVRLCRGTMAEGMNMKEKDVFEDAGIDTDESLKLAVRDFSNMISKKVRRWSHV